MLISLEVSTFEGWWIRLYTPHLVEDRCMWICLKSVQWLLRSRILVQLSWLAGCGILGTYVCNAPGWLCDFRVALPPTRQCFFFFFFDPFECKASFLFFLNNDVCLQPWFGTYFFYFLVGVSEQPASNSDALPAEPLGSKLPCSPAP